MTAKALKAKIEIEWEEKEYHHPPQVPQLRINQLPRVARKAAQSKVYPKRIRRYISEHL